MGERFYPFLDESGLVVRSCRSERVGTRAVKRSFPPQSGQDGFHLISRKGKFESPTAYPRSSSVRGYSPPGDSGPLSAKVFAPNRREYLGVANMEAFACPTPHVQSF